MPTQSLAFMVRIRAWLPVDHQKMGSLCGSPVRLINDRGDREGYGMTDSDYGLVVGAAEGHSKTGQKPNKK